MKVVYLGNDESNFIHNLSSELYKYYGESIIVNIHENELELTLPFESKEKFKITFNRSFIYWLKDDGSEELLFFKYNRNTTFTLLAMEESAFMIYQGDSGDLYGGNSIALFGQTSNGTVFFSSCANPSGIEEARSISLINGKDLFPATFGNELFTQEKIVFKQPFRLADEEGTLYSFEDVYNISYKEVERVFSPHTVILGTGLANKIHPFEKIETSLLMYNDKLGSDDLEGESSGEEDQFDDTEEIIELDPKKLQFIEVDEPFIPEIENDIRGLEDIPESVPPVYYNEKLGGKNKTYVLEVPEFLPYKGGQKKVEDLTQLFIRTTDEGVALPNIGENSSVILKSSHPIKRLPVFYTKNMGIIDYSGLNLDELEQLEFSSFPSESTEHIIFPETGQYYPFPDNGGVTLMNWSATNTRIQNLELKGDLSIEFQGSFKNLDIDVFNNKNQFKIIPHETRFFPSFLRWMSAPAHKFDGTFKEVTINKIDFSTLIHTLNFKNMFTNSTINSPIDLTHISTDDKFFEELEKEYQKYTPENSPEKTLAWALSFKGLSTPSVHIHPNILDKEFSVGKDETRTIRPYLEEIAKNEGFVLSEEPADNISFEKEV